MILTFYLFLLCGIFVQSQNQTDCKVEIPIEEFWDDLALTKYVTLITAHKAAVAVYQRPVNNAEYLINYDLLNVTDLLNTGDILEGSGLDINDFLNGTSTVIGNILEGSGLNISDFLDDASTEIGDILESLGINIDDFFDDASTEIDFGEYDFIVVGAGSAGSALAYGLSELDDWKVLLIEAGGNETDFSNIPLFSLFLGNSRMDWGYFTVQQNNACQSTLGKCIYSRGKVLGGSGAINALMYVRCNKADYDSWASKGNPGWSYDDVLPYFIKQEHSHINCDRGYLGRDGLISVDYPVPDTPLLAYFLDANKAAGRRILVDYNGIDQLGAARTQFSIRHGRRQSGGSVYLSRAKCRENLHIVQNALVTKILVDDSKKAFGVEFLKSGKKYTATVTKEVIVSGGSINTPQLLLLSGIGPKEELEQLDVDVVHDLPGVGQNLQDHVIIPLIFTTNYTTSKFTAAELTRMYLGGFGPYTKPFGTEAFVFLKVNSSTLAPTVPDIQILFVPRISDVNEVIPQNGFLMVPILLHPKSIGSVTLTSKNPLEFPAIDPKYLEAEEDLQIMYEGIEALFELIETEPFQQIGITFVPIPLPECDVLYEFRSRDYWICSLKYFALSGWHPTSTATMGNDSNAVVDHRLRVHGIQNLRVADCSVIPNVPSGNTNAPAFMIGLKASDIIKDDYNNSTK